jgi:DNA-binding NtrC family response regulator
VAAKTSATDPAAGILIVDDDPSVIASLSLLLGQHGFEPMGAADPSEALAMIDDPACRLVLQDMNFSRATSGDEGLALLAEIRRRRPELPVVLLTAWGSIELAVRGIKQGAADFVTKPWGNAQLLQSIRTVLSLAASRAPAGERAPRREELDERYDFGKLLGNDPALLRMLELVGRVSATDASVLISGESGTGKELVAEAIHRNSPRARQPFVKVNLGGISSTLFESEMFGHVRGAFTDAKSERPGRFEMADGGTIFLDEIGEVELSAQVKLLRVLQDRTYEVLGSSTTRRVDVRVISATNRDLAEMVAAGGFREDLLYRLNLISIELPPLRRRSGDIPLLAGAFLGECAERYGRDGLQLSPAAVEWLRVQRWPGNVRQLRQVIERSVLVTEVETLEPAHLAELAQLDAAALSADDLPAAGSVTLEELERKMIEKCLLRYQGNVSQVARALGLSRPALYRRCEKYGLRIDRG